jgi:hypothetical protein
LEGYLVGFVVWGAVVSSGSDEGRAVVLLTVCVKELPWSVAVDSDVGAEPDDFAAPFQ